jgi:hypothetical protein
MESALLAKDGDVQRSNRAANSLPERDEVVFVHASQAESIYAECYVGDPSYTTYLSLAHKTTPSEVRHQLLQTAGRLRFPRTPASG